MRTNDGKQTPRAAHITSAGLFACALIGCGLSLMAVGTPARADVRYTMQTKTGGVGDGAAAPGMPVMRMTTYVKNKRQRQEMTMQMGQFKMNSVTLTMCDTHQTAQLAPDLKIYTVSPMGSMAGASPVAGLGAGRAGGREEKPGKGKIVMTYAVKDMGTEKVADVTARHYALTMRIQQSGCIGDSDNTLRQELWVAPIKAGLDCPESFAPTRTVPNENGCEITHETKGDVAALREIYGGMIVRLKMFNGDQVISTQELREYSLAALDDALFTLPADYKKVSAEEFAKAQQQAMMKAFTPGGAGAPKDDADDKDDDDKDDDDKDDDDKDDDDKDGDDNEDGDGR